MPYSRRGKWYVNISFDSHTEAIEFEEQYAPKKESCIDMFLDYQFDRDGRALLNKYTWRRHRCDYLYRYDKVKIYFHRELMGVDKDVRIRFFDGNKKNLKKENLYYENEEIL